MSYTPAPSSAVICTEMLGTGGDNATRSSRIALIVGLVATLTVGADMLLRRSLVQMVEDDLGEPMTYFEITTAMAFEWMSERSVAAGIIETGLGGRWDATNVTDAPVAAITNIGLDHTERLGPSLTSIAGVPRSYIAEVDHAGVAMPWTVDADADVHEAYRILGTHGVRRLPVVAGDDIVGARANPLTASGLAPERNRRPRLPASSW